METLNQLRQKSFAELHPEQRKLLTRAAALEKKIARARGQYAKALDKAAAAKAVHQAAAAKALSAENKVSELDKQLLAIEEVAFESTKTKSSN